MMRGSTAYMAASDGWIDYAADEPGSHRRRVCFWLRDDVPGNEIMVEYQAVNGRAMFTRVEMEPSEGDDEKLKSYRNGNGNGKANGKWKDQAKAKTGRPRTVNTPAEGPGRPKVDYTQLQTLVMCTLANQADGLKFDDLRDLLGVGKNVLYDCTQLMQSRGLIQYNGRTHTWGAS